MTSEEWRQVRGVFDAALRRDPEEREAFLDEACAGNPQLRSEVASLLDAHDRAGDFMESPDVKAAPDLRVDDPLGHASAATTMGTPLEHPSTAAAPGTPLGHPGEQSSRRMVGPYIIRHEIGRGGMGVVYLADDMRLSRRVALKALPPDVCHDAGRRERLRQEARAAAALSHPGIATVYALEEIGDELYIACEYVAGQTLRTMLESGPLPLGQVADIAVQLARALTAAHNQGVIHRDLKPENVMRTATGVVKVLDFGVARVESLVPARLTQTGTILGTPAYMAPEQAQGLEIDFRTDLFSLGVLVYEMASGTNPFEATTLTATIARILEVEPAALSEVCPAGPPRLERIVATCLRKNPGERYRSTSELLADLEQLQADMPTVRDRTGSRRAEAAQAGRSSRARTPRWWWEFHQVMISAVYVSMIYPAWHVRPWLPQPAGIAFLFSVLACAAVATSLRLHLLFTARYYASELSGQRARAWPWTRWSDAGFSAALFGGALAIGSAHLEFSTLLITVSIVTAVASFMIEPATTRAAFRGTRGSSKFKVQSSKEG
jgi:serine/threonine-protein kinase